MHGHVLVWLDQKSARLFRIQRDIVGTAGVGPDQIVHHQDESHAGRSDDKAFFSDIAEGLTGADGILIVGPGEEKANLSKWLSERCPDIASNVWAVEAIDHPTDPQLIAHGKAYFGGQEKMRTDQPTQRSLPWTILTQP